MVSINDFKEYTKFRMEDVKQCLDKFNTSVPVWIWSEEHQAYWRPDGAGYTVNSDEAGVYTLGQAFNTTRHCCPQQKIWYIWIPIEHCSEQQVLRDFMEAAWEIYQEWLTLKQVQSLPDYEKAFLRIKEKLIDNN